MGIDFASTVSGLNTNKDTFVESKTNALESKLNNSDLSKASDDELMKVCKDFESYFVEQMIKSMEKMSKLDSSDNDSSTGSLFSTLAGTKDDPSMNTLTSYFGDEMTSNYAKMLTEANAGEGLGMAQMLYEQMKRNYSVPT